VISGLLILSCGADPARKTARDGASCSTLADVVGPEDFEIVFVDDRADRLLVSSQDRRNPAEAGAIYSVSLTDASRGAFRLRLLGRGDCSFHPHGIALGSGPRSDRLYVINHHEARDFAADRSCFPLSSGSDSAGTSVEVFEVHNTELKFLGRLAEPTVLTGGNDLAVDAAGRVYVTVPPVSNIQRLQEVMYDAGISKVVRYCPPDAACSPAWAVVAHVGRYVNGIAVEAEADRPQDIRLLVTSTLDGTIHRIDPAHQSAHLLRTFGLGHDNLTWVHGTDDLLVASHPESRRFLQHAASPDARSPSKVWRFSSRSGGEPALVFHDDGTTISAASTAACANGALILGQIFGDSVLSCRTTHCPPKEVAR
jgi:hypothetical protein